MSQVIADRVAVEVLSYIDGRGGEYSQWYVGVASSARDRLFNDHGVKEHDDVWIVRDCDDSQTARSVEVYFVEQLGMDGGTGGGDASTTFVYAYRKASHTRE